MANKSQKVEIKYFDVSKPGKTAPDPTSRPTIVGQRTILKDPMVTADQKNNKNAEEDKPLAPSSPNIKIAPLDQATEVKPDNRSDEESKVVVEVDKKTEIKPEIKAEVKANDTVEDKKTSEDSTSAPAGGSAEDSPGSGGNTDVKAEAQKKADKEAQEEAAKNQANEKLIAEKTYYVPIGEKKHRRSRTRGIVWGIFILILLALLGDLLIDSGTIKTSIKPPLSFFNNE